ncbi:MAG: molybdate transport system ATP-binding protein [bacterium]|jgi:molybdate transport system ATP-binding protein
MTISAKFFFHRGQFKLDVDFTVPAYGVTALFGSSGCGKTTLLRAIAGLEHSKNGYLKVGSSIWQDHTQFLKPYQRPVGYIFQEPSLFPHLSVIKNLEYGFKRIPKKERKITLDEAVDLLGIEEMLSRNPSKLSGGERQRVAIARALLTSPRLLLMDEPLSALDQKSKAEILPFLEQLHQKLDIPVFYVSHSHEEVAHLADYLVLMDAGKIQAMGSVEEMFIRTDLPLAYGNDAGAIIEANIEKHLPDDFLTQLIFSGGNFLVAQKDFPLGNQVRLRVLAKDVSLTLEHQQGTSILNIFPAIVQEIIEESRAKIQVKLDLNGTIILSRITKKSAHDLELIEGKKVYAQVKSVAIMT